MGKKRRDTQRKTTRKKQHHSHDASLPDIEANPNFNNKEVSYLPRIFVDCDTNISQRSIKKLQRYLRFADHHDLRYLSSIRIVEPSALIFPSKMTASGCYCPKWKERPPQIWLSSRLFTFSGFKSLWINVFFLRRDELFETLFHELGHHKAERVRFVSNHKHEAYAEKYMQTYKYAWQQRQRWRALGERILKGMLPLLCNRYTMLLYLFIVRNKNAAIRQMYQLQLQHVFRKISMEEMCDEMSSTLFQHSSSAKKKKRLHPLQQESYRQKFGLDDTHNEV